MPPVECGLTSVVPFYENVSDVPCVVVLEVLCIVEIVDRDFTSHGDYIA